MSKGQPNEVTGRIFDGATLRKILAQVQPYRGRFVATGALVVLLSGLVWVRPALIRIAVVALHYGGTVSFEWPKRSQLWLLKELLEFITKHDMIDYLSSTTLC